MNITRFKWPVIIAAGLHGALFIPFSRDYIRIPPATDGKVGLRPMPKETEIELPIPAETETPTAGGGEPVTSLPEAPPPATHLQGRRLRCRSSVATLCRKNRRST